jgi:tRNA(Phe) wybutosine-synthesizing methylase Tyw3
LPDPWELLKKPESFKVPNRSDILFAVLSSVATAAVNNLTVSNWNAAWKIFAAAANSGHKDVAASSIKQLVLAHKSNLPMPVKELTIFEPILKQLFKAGYITN